MSAIHGAIIGGLAVALVLFGAVYIVEQQDGGSTVVVQAEPVETAGPVYREAAPAPVRDTSAIDRINERNEQQREEQQERRDRNLDASEQRRLMDQLEDIEDAVGEDGFERSSPERTIERSVERERYCPEKFISCR